MTLQNNKQEKINGLLVNPSASLRDAMKQMDAVNTKLLIVAQDKSKFVSLLSIGDLQRALINDKQLTDPIQGILRRNINVCKTSETFEEIKNKMLVFRTEFMPVLNEDGQIHDVIFWEEVIQEHYDTPKGSLDLPVIVMAGGQGTRLKPITNIIPKALVPIGTKPVIEHIMDTFVACGIKDFHLSVNYKAEMIQQYFDGLPDRKYAVSYFKEEKPLGTAGSLYLLKDKITSTFIVTNCDIIIDVDYKDVYDYHIEQKNDLTLIAAIKNYPIPYGTIETTLKGQLTELREKPELTFLINAGMYFLEPQLLQDVQDNEFMHITELIEKILARNGKVGVFPVSEGSWFDVGEWKDYLNTQQLFASRFRQK